MGSRVQKTSTMSASQITVYFSLQATISCPNSALAVLTLHKWLLEATEKLASKGKACLGTSVTIIGRTHGIVPDPPSQSWAVCRGAFGGGGGGHHKTLSAPPTPHIHIMRLT